MQVTDEDLTTELRDWARGLLGLEAATELLIRGGFAGPGRPWVKDGSPMHWIDFAAIPDLIGAMSGGEQRYLRIAASLSGEASIILEDNLSSLDYERANFVLIAVAHTAGFTAETADFYVDDAGDPHRRMRKPLASWPV